jgi:hypothetical protein
MFTLVACEWIKIHHENVSLINLNRCYKIANENVPSLNKFEQNINYFQ